MKEINLDFYKPETKPKLNRKNKIVPHHLQSQSAKKIVSSPSSSVFNSKSTPTFSVNEELLSKNHINSNKKKKRNVAKFIFLLLPVLLVATVLGGFYWLTVPAAKALDTNPLSILADKVTGNKAVLNSTSGRVSILIMGVDNRSDQLTNDLKQIGNTDTMMIASYDSNTNKVELLSIARDIGLYYRTSGGFKSSYYDKINGLVSYGANNNYKGGGGQLIRDTIKDITGITINYTVIIDMDAFVQVIDTLGGIDINVENTFCDAGYPLQGDTGVETIKFYQGVKHMDGKTALKFSRSRVHNICPNMTAGSPVFEGTDFRRGYRQQQVIGAVQDKATKIGFDLFKLQQLISSVGNNVLTQIGDGPMTNDNKLNLQTLQAFYDLRNKVQKKDEYNYVASQTACGGNAIKEYNHPDGYYLIPIKPSDFSGLSSCVQFYLSNPEVLTENASISVYNTGIGSTKSSAVSQEINTNYFLNSNYMQTISLPKALVTPTIDITHGNYVYGSNILKPQTLKFLAKTYNAQIITKDDLPKSLQNIFDIDILLFTGSTS